MITEVEIAKSGRAHCRGCGKTIANGTPRGLSYSKGWMGHKETNYYCYLCTEKLLKVRLDECEDDKITQEVVELAVNPLLKELDNLKKTQVREMIVGAL